MEVVTFGSGEVFTSTFVFSSLGWDRFSVTGAISPEFYSTASGWDSAYNLESVDPATEWVSMDISAEASNKITFGAWFCRHDLYSQDTDNYLFQLVENGTVHLTVMGTANGSIEVRRGDHLGTVLVTSDYTDWWSGVDNVPQYLEFTFVVHDSTGFVGIYYDGSSTPLVSFSGDTRNGGTSGAIDEFRWLGSADTTMGFYWVYWYLMSDYAGSRPDRLGRIRVRSNTSTLQGADTAWGGTENDVDDWDAATGITSSTNGQRESFQHGALDDVVYPGSVIAAEFHVLAIDVGTPGDGQIKLGLRSNGGTYAFDTAFQPASTVQPKAALFFNDPATGSPWASGEPGRANMDTTQTVVEAVIA